MRTFPLVSAFALAAVCVCHAQAKSSSVETTYGSCSPNMSHNSGSIVINCKGLDPAVAAEIAELVTRISQLNKTTATAKNQQLMIKVLGEIQATVSSALENPQTVVGPITTGPCSNVQVGGVGNKSQANCGPVERHLTVDQKTALVAALAGRNVKVDFVALVNVPDAQRFAFELCSAFKVALPATNCHIDMVVEDSGAPWAGFKITYRGDPQEDGHVTTFSRESPVGIVEHAMVAAGLNRGVGHADPNMKDGEVTVVVGFPPQ